MKLIKSLFILAALAIVGCAGARYEAVCKDAPHSAIFYGNPGHCTCPAGMTVVRKTKFGTKTYEIVDCSEHMRVYRVKRIKGAR